MIAETIVSGQGHSVTDLELRSMISFVNNQYSGVHTPVHAVDACTPVVKAYSSDYYPGKEGYDIKDYDKGT